MSVSVAKHQAYRRAWFSLLLYPLSFAAAFAVGEGLVSLYGYPTSGPQSTPLWAVLAAGGPAMLVFAVPAVVAWVFAARAGHEDVHRVRLPAYVATALAVAFVLMNLLSFALGRLVG